jgi:hypothetical protein
MHRTRPARTNEPTIPFPKTASRCLYSALWIAQNVGYQRPVLLWVTESGVCDSNGHMYYRLRQSYQDFRLIDEAPGHYFLGHESEDLASFIQLVMVNGWDAYLLTEIDCINAFFSHDGFTDVFSNNKALLDEFCKNAGDDHEAVTESTVIRKGGVFSFAARRAVCFNCCSSPFSAVAFSSVLNHLAQLGGAFNRPSEVAFFMTT